MRGKEILNKKCIHCESRIISLILVVHHDLRISPRLSEKIQNDPYAVFRGLGEMGEDDSRKKPEAKNPLTPSISCTVKRVDEVVPHRHLVTQDQTTQVSNKFFHIHV